jgi:hypothetical protein
MSTPKYDPLRKRPLELRVRDMSDVGGISDVDATRLSRKSADALVVIRFLIDPNEDGDVRIHQELLSLYGASGEPLGTEALFGAWLSMAEFIMNRPVYSPEDERRRNFLVHVRKLLGLDLATRAIQDLENGVADRAAPTPPTDAGEPTSG